MQNPTSKELRRRSLVKSLLWRIIGVVWTWVGAYIILSLIPPAQRSGALIENNMLALVAYRTGQKLEWDAKNLKATNCPEADRYIYKKYRKGWVLNG